MKTIKAVNLHELKKINKNSIREGYNRNIYFTRFKMDLMSEMKKDPTMFGHWSGMETKVCVQPIMIHEHKGGVKTQKHMRCMIQTTFDDLNPIIDITMSDYNRIKDYEIHTAKEVSKEESNVTPLIRRKQ